MSAYHRAVGSKKGRVVIHLDETTAGRRDHEGDLPGEWSFPAVEASSTVDLHVVVIDHRDSFTYNLVQSLSAAGARISVRLAETLTIDQLEQLSPDRLLLSPGPGSPARADFARQALERYRGQIPILGVCLGHQVIALSLGACVEPTGTPAHGKAEPVFHDGSGIFRGVPNPFAAARYHSLAVCPENLPKTLQVVARSESGMVMGVGVAGEATWGLQFHPESFLTPAGNLILSSFLSGIVCEEDLDRQDFERTDSHAH
ncbi:MAG: aminodeoxychorismate/anthranilate synthase component II [Planctomycetota bacterium]